MVCIASNGLNADRIEWILQDSSLLLLGGGDFGSKFFDLMAHRWFWSRFWILDIPKLHDQIVHEFRIGIEYGGKDWDANIKRKFPDLQSSSKFPKAVLETRKERCSGHYVRA